MASMFVPFADSLIDPALLALEQLPGSEELENQAKSPELPSQPLDPFPTPPHEQQAHHSNSDPPLPEPASPSQITKDYVSRPPLDGRPQVRSRALNQTKSERKDAALKAADKARNLKTELSVEWERQLAASADLALKYGITIKNMRTLTQHQSGYAQKRKPNLWNAWLRANALSLNEGK